MGIILLARGYGSFILRWITGVLALPLESRQPLGIRAAVASQYSAPHPGYASRRGISAKMRSMAAKRRK